MFLHGQDPEQTSCLTSSDPLLRWPPGPRSCSLDAASICRIAVHSNYIFLDQQAKKAHCHKLMSLRRPMSAVLLGIGFSAVESDKWDLLGLKMLNELGVAGLKADK
jgi:hypothetical protein